MSQAAVSPSSPLSATAPSAPPRPDRIMQMAWGFAAPLILESAVRMKLFDHLQDSPKSADQLAGETDSSPRALRQLLNALVSLDFLTKSADRYALTPESAAFLITTKPSFQGGLFRHISRQLIPKWLTLEECVRTGRPAMSVNTEAVGSPFFHDFVEDIFNMSWAAAGVLADHLQLASAAAPVRVLDLAAGSGVWGIALASKSPRVTVTAVDWPGVLDVTRRVASRHKLAERFTFVPGDLASADFGTGHSLATLGHILHSEGPDRSQALLKKTFAALAPGGTIAIAEFLANDTRTGPPQALIFALNMLVNTDSGDTFTFPEISSWLTSAGFKNPRLLDAPGPSPLLLASKPA